MAPRRRSKKPAKRTTRLRRSKAGKSTTLRTRREQAIGTGRIAQFKAAATGTKAQDARVVLQETRQELVNQKSVPGWSDADLVRIDRQVAHVDKTILDLDLDNIADPPNWMPADEAKFREKLCNAENENKKIRAVVNVITKLESYTAAAEKYVREAVKLLTG